MYVLRQSVSISEMFTLTSLDLSRMYLNYVFPQVYTRYPGKFIYLVRKSNQLSGHDLYRFYRPSIRLGLRALLCITPRWYHLPCPSYLSFDFFLPFFFVFYFAAYTSSVMYVYRGV